MKIAVFGLDYIGANKGCQALSFSFFELLKKLSKETNKDLDIHVCIQRNINRTTIFKESIKKYIFKPDILYSLNNNHIHFTKYIYDESPHNFKYIKKALKGVEYAFDFTAGDSFSDIYGNDRFIKRTTVKKFIADTGVKLILGPQTIGPFKIKENEIFAKQVMDQCYQIYARDNESFMRAKISTNKSIYQTTDIAFLLPYDKSNPPKNTKIKVGINISGLLYRGGYTKNNQFNLTVDYCLYCHSIIENLIKKGYEIHLISHVNSLQINSIDNDWFVCKQLQSKYPQCILAPFFHTAMDAKSYISQMDVFTGARMHATIGASSQGIPTIPFSYSTKFEGLYNRNGYNYCIHGTTSSTKKAIEDTLKFIEQRDELRISVRQFQIKELKEIDIFYYNLKELLINQAKHL